MFDTPVIERTYRGSWKEVLSHRDEIPDTSEVELKVLNPQANTDEERASLQEMIDHLLKGLGRIAEKEHRPVDEIGEELIRQARFPEIEFRDILDERVACVKGRLEVWQVMMIAQSYGDDLQGVADHLVMRPEQVRCALDYYAAYPNAIDAALAENDANDYETMKRRYPKMKIGLWEVTDEALARLEREYPLEDLRP